MSILLYYYYQHTKSPCSLLFIILRKTWSSYQHVIGMGNANQHMAQERHKRILMNLDPVLKSIENHKKSLKKGVPMLFGDEFAKLITERVDQLKAISKF